VSSGDVGGVRLVDVADQAARLIRCLAQRGRVVRVPPRHDELGDEPGQFAGMEFLESVQLGHAALRGAWQFVPFDLLSAVSAIGVKATST
jgi:hypothetical protein